MARTFDLDQADRTPEGAPRAAPARSLPHLPLGAPGAEVGEHGPDLALVAPLGEGGMGVVWRARQASLGREVAVKRLKPDAPARSGEALLREARFMGGLDHPNVVPVHALGLEDEDRPVLVMKRIEGVDWHTLLREPNHPYWQGEPPDERLARHVEILIELCRALQFAHARGVVHRDVKPENVMVGAYGEVYLMDWGVAARWPDEAVTGTIVGTPAYMPPELATIGAPFGPASDVFLLGACLVEVLTGAPPWDARAAEDALAQARACPPLALAAAPPELADIARRACVAEPAGRWRDVGSLQKALLAWTRQRHALRLVAAARERLEALRILLADPDGARARVESSFSECRFGFAQALEAGPGLEAAREGLRDAFAVMVPYAIRHGDLELARVHLDALAELDGEVGPLEQALDAAVRTRAAEHALAHELDPDVGRRQRLAWTGAVAVVTAAFSGLVLFLPKAGRTFGHVEAIAVVVAFTMLLPPVFWVAGRWVTLNRVTRALVALFVTADLGVLAHRLLAWRFDAPIPEMLATDLVLMAMAAVGWGVVDQRLAPLATVYVAGAVTIAIWPAIVVPLFGATLLGGVVLSGLLLLRLG